MYIHGYTWYIHDGYTRISMYIPRISTPLDIHGISMDIRVYPIDIGQDGIYMGYTWYSMYILEIGIPDDGSRWRCSHERRVNRLQHSAYPCITLIRKTSNIISSLLDRVWLMIRKKYCVRVLNHEGPSFFLEWPVHGPNARNTLSSSWSRNIR